MGADGGSLPTRAEQVKTRQQEARSDPIKLTRLRLNYCALSGLALDTNPDNLACDSVGNLFNLERLLDAMLDAKKRKALRKQFGIQKMKVLEALFAL